MLRAPERAIVLPLISEQGEPVAATLEEAPLGGVGRELDGAVVGGERVVVPAGPGEEVGAGGVVRLVVGERVASSASRASRPAAGAVAARRWRRPG